MWTDRPVTFRSHSEFITVTSPTVYHQHQPPSHHCPAADLPTSCMYKKKALQITSTYHENSDVPVQSNLLGKSGQEIINHRNKIYVTDCFIGVMKWGKKIIKIFCHWASQRPHVLSYITSEKVSTFKCCTFSDGPYAYMTMTIYRHIENFFLSLILRNTS